MCNQTERMIHLQEQARKSLAEWDKQQKLSGPGQPNRIDIIWGWDGIADALNISRNTAVRLCKNHGLPLFFRPGPQTTRANLQLWAEGKLIMNEQGELVITEPQKPEPE